MNGIIIMTLIAFVLSICLVFLDAFLKKEDDKLEDIKSHLPGYNCGACGFGSCEGMAKAITENGESYLLCRPMKQDKKEELERYLKANELLK